MKVKDAIKKADDLRMNTVSEEQKYAWIYELEGKLSDSMRTPVPENPYPEDAELQMPFPYDNIYAFYLAAMIDYYNSEIYLYANDMSMFNAAYNDAVSWWIRNNRPAYSGNWRIM